MKYSSVLAAGGLALACASGIARADVDASKLHPQDASVPDSSATDRSAHTPNASTEEPAAADAGWPTQARICLGLAVVGVFVLLGRRRGFD